MPQYILEVFENGEKKNQLAQLALVITLKMVKIGFN